MFYYYYFRCCSSYCCAVFACAKKKRRIKIEEKHVEEADDEAASRLIISKEAGDETPALSLSPGIGIQIGFWCGGASSTLLYIFLLFFDCQI